MITVRQLLHEKEQELWSIHPDKSVRDAMKMMIERDIGSLLIIADGRLLGIITERKCARRIVCHGETSGRVKAWEIMEPPVPSVCPNDTVEECMTLMTERRVRYLPVLSQ